MSHPTAIALTLTVLAACGGHDAPPGSLDGAPQGARVEAPSPEPDAAAVVLKINNAPPRVAVGDTLALQAVASVGDASVDAGEIAWSTSDAEVVAISSDGSATAVGVGRAWVTASADGGSTAMVEIDVR